MHIETEQLQCKYKKSMYLLYSDVTLPPNSNTNTSHKYKIQEMYHQGASWRPSQEGGYDG